MSGEWGGVYSWVIFVGATKWIEVFDDFNVDFDAVLEGEKPEKIEKSLAFSIGL
ncbi:hypothetical protein [Burkholderia sola]|uniref:hypothetical protein n=1 Tax=Burkholderia sola TaxID=2843302 RepID=UPI0023DDE74E|nr:hypothetical protein [Burkholderia sola]MDF3084532.1 hypothetical protein [Burkholderia sola]